MGNTIWTPTSVAWQSWAAGNLRSWRNAWRWSDRWPRRIVPWREIWQGKRHQRWNEVKLVDSWIAVLLALNNEIWRVPWCDISKDSAAVKSVGPSFHAMLFSISLLRPPYCFWIIFCLSSQPTDSSVCSCATLLTPVHVLCPALGRCSAMTSRGYGEIRVQYSGIWVSNVTRAIQTAQPLGFGQGMVSVENLKSHSCVTNFRRWWYQNMLQQYRFWNL